VTLADWVAEAKASAAVVEHPWDVQALDWPLTAESVVVEVGGYKGRWALQIAERYAPRLMVQLHGADDANANAALFDRLAASGYRVAWTFGTVLTAWEHNQ
jgi:hypothetical protein